MNKIEFFRAAAAPFETRYGNFIGGKWIAPAAGRYFDNFSPVNGQKLCEVARSDAEDVEAALDAAHAAKDAWGRTSAGRARAGPEPHRRPDGGEPRAPRPRRDLGQRQADPRDDRRGPAARHRPLPLFRRRDPRPGRLALRDRRRHRRLPLPRAARRRRPDHPVELPAPDGGLEARPRARRRQLRGAEARRADAGLDPGARRASSATSCRRACSTSSTASASRPASRSPPPRASPRSPSPARRRPAG